MIFEHKISKSVEFSHTDMAGIMHFSNFFRFMEAVEHDFFRSLGESVVGGKDAAGNVLGWPRINCHCNFSAPLKFEDEVHLHFIIREVGNSTFKYEVIFSKMIDGQLMECARGGVTVVHVGFNPDNGDLKAKLLPAWLKSAVCTAPLDYEVRMS